mmetsp:Transcript_88184/g.153201  ORF Transcript_88184/g.153201 Transcript_88184/m.153201 type:complete len:115 (-) Transcript_88184:1901-2245(-)
MPFCTVVLKPSYLGQSNPGCMNVRHFGACSCCMAIGTGHDTNSLCCLQQKMVSTRRYDKARVCGTLKHCGSGVQSWHVYVMFVHVFCLHHPPPEPPKHTHKSHLDFVLSLPTFF